MNPLVKSVRGATGLALLSLLPVACGGTQQERARVAEIQREADQRVEVIRRESEKQAAEARRQIERLEADLAAKNEELDRTLRGRTAASPDESFAAERRTLEDKARAALSRLDEEARDIDARSRALAKAARANVEAELARANQARKQVEGDLGELDSATRQTFRELSDRLERDLDALDESLRNARRKVE